MKITIATDSGETIHYQDVCDAFLTVRYKDLAADESARPVHVVTSRSQSWGPNPRELVKEVTQSLVELQDILRERRHGGSS